MEKQSAADAARADAARRESDIAVGDLVMLSTRNLKLRAVGAKFKPRYVGPYRVIASAGRNAFKLELPRNMAVHPTFNVALLRKYRGNQATPQPVDIDGEQHYEIERIIAHYGGYRNRRYLVRWLGYDASEDMWLPERELAHSAAQLLKKYKSRQHIR